jgi:hypothetical protein
MTDTPKRAPIDWEMVELEYRANIKSLKVIGAEYGVSDAGIIKRAKAKGWTRDLGAKIRAKAEAKVSASAVSAEVSAQTHANQQQVIEANATLQSGIILAHRSDIQRSRKLTMSLLAELEHQVDHVELYEQLGELLAQPDEKGQDKRLELFNKAMSLSSRTGTMKGLADSLKTLIALERQAFGVDEREATGDGGIESVIKRVMQRQGE